MSARHPGLRMYIAMRLDAGATLAEIHAEVKKRFGPDITRSALHHYKLKRWLPATKRVQALVEQSEGILRVIEEYGADRAVLAYIFEQLIESKSRGESPAPAVLLKEQRELAKLQLQREVARAELRRKNRELQLKHATRGGKAAKSSNKAPQNEAAPLDGGAPAKPFDPAAVYRQISAVIGVGGPPEERREKTASSEVVSGE